MDSMQSPVGFSNNPAFGNSTLFAYVYNRTTTSEPWTMVNLNALRNPNITGSTQGCALSITDDASSLFMTVSALASLNIFTRNSSGDYNLFQSIVKPTLQDTFNTWADWDSAGTTLIASGIRANTTLPYVLRVYKRANTSELFTLSQTIEFFDSAASFWGYRCRISPLARWVLASAPDAVLSGFVTIYELNTGTGLYNMVYERLRIGNNMTAPTTTGGAMNLGSAEFSYDEQWLTVGIMRWPFAYTYGGLAVFHLDTGSQNWTFVNVLSWPAASFPYPLETSAQGVSIGVCQDATVIAVAFGRLTTGGVRQASCLGIWEGRR